MLKHNNYFNFTFRYDPGAKVGNIVEANVIKLYTVVIYEWAE
jgi:hypothetical protein